MRKSLDLITLTLLGILTGASSSTPDYPTDCTPNTWVNLTSLPSPRQEHSTVAVNSSTIAVVGGVVSSAEDFHGLSINTTDLVQFYDIPSDQWRTVTPAPYRFNHPNVAVLDGKIYLLGGLTEYPPENGGTINWVASPECAVYDPTADAWTNLTSMPPGTERGSAITGVYGDLIYLAGGMTVLKDTYQDAVNTVTAFNTSSGTWLRLPPPAAVLPEGREHGTGAVIDDTLYVVGGRVWSQLDVRGTVFSLDLTNLTSGWQTGPATMPVPRGGLSGDAVGSKMYTFGGEGDQDSASGVFDQSEAYDVKQQQWTELPAMAVPRHGTHAAAVGGRVYIPGGGLQQDGKPVTVNGTVIYGHSTAHFDAFCV